MRKELTDRVLKELRFVGNFVNALAHPLEYSVISYRDGTVTHHRLESHEITTSRGYEGLKQELKYFWTFLREVLSYERRK